MPLCRTELGDPVVRVVQLLQGRNPLLVDPDHVALCLDGAQAL